MSIHSLVTGWLLLVSLIFYGYWEPRFLLLLLVSVGVNWLIGEVIVRLRSDLPDSQSMTNAIRAMLFLGIALNLGAIGYFKYINFFIDIINSLGASLGKINGLVLPLGISFYTFEQITYLVGIALGKGRSYGLPQFLLFVTFFPHLIAGPILSAKELIPQFRSLNYRFNTRSLAIGFTVFTIGLFKKTVLADSVAGYATPIFEAADNGQVISFFLSWQAAIAYTLQLYFDFSGYSDMAIGLARLFNIKLPINFFSPYKAIGISDFWRRWHISLSRFLRHYLYIPLGGSRKGEVRRYLNLFITMLLGGLWHGANWTFLLWGGLHGIYLCIDRGWQQFLKQRNWKPSGRLSRIAAQALTFVAVVISWVLFRAETLEGAKRILCGMAGFDGFILPESYATKLQMLTRFGIEFGTVENFGDIQAVAIILSLLIAVFLLPNVYEFMKGEPVALDVYQHLDNLDNKATPWWGWKPKILYAVLIGILFCIGVGFCNSRSEFLYFQF
ncbi:MAG: MBOAT family O-acyltransferase [Nostoc sp.]|uniref:MBOAT family O-acyltransferase n=1 Tax=Nostoc sp. TaxID=1180 RepID=UPI002FFC2C3A